MKQNKETLAIAFRGNRGWRGRDGGGDLTNVKM
jgi:hypothetical protein